jgi:hypothetical protein
MQDAFDLIDIDDGLPPKQASTKPSKTSGDAFDAVMPFNKESKLRSFLRTVMQAPLGLAKRYTFPLDLMQMMGTGAALDPEEIDQIRKISLRAGIPFDEEKYLQAVQNAQASFPTQGNVESLLEQQTGAPLKAQTGLQKVVNIGSTAAAFPQALSQKATAAVTAPSVAAGLQAMGIPEVVAETVGLGASGIAAAKTPAISRQVAKKPSGIPEKQFESIRAKRQVSEKKLGQINESIESDFKKIADELIQDSQAGITVRKLEQDPMFKSKVGEKFQQVEKLSEQITDPISSDAFRNIVKSKVKEFKGITPSEYEKTFTDNIKTFSKNINQKNISASDLVAQYRKNNRSLSELYDPSKSYASNRAKKDSLIEYNQAIAEMIDSKYPNTEFSKLFKEANQQWAAISDVEAIDKFFEKMFDGGIQFKQAKKFLDNKNISRPFERALGDNFPKFRDLMKDMIGSEKTYNMLNLAKKKGFDDLFSSAAGYVIHPNLGKARLMMKISKSTYNSFMNSALQNPKMILQLEKGIHAINKGDFGLATEIFNKLDREVEKL